MPGMKKKATPSPKPTIAGLKKSNLDKVASKVKGFKNVNLDKPKSKISEKVKSFKNVNLDKPKAKVTPKPSASSKLGPLPKNPTLNDYLLRGLKVPQAPGQKKLPSDSDIVLKKYKKKK